MYVYVYRHIHIYIYGTDVHMCSDRLTCVVHLQFPEDLQYRTTAPLSEPSSTSPEDGKTPLALAAMQGHGEMVDDLINAGAEVSRRSKSFKGPFWGVL